MAEKAYIEYENLRIPLKIKKEWRRSVRYSISKKSINLTVPSFYTKTQINLEYNKIKDWSYMQFRQSPRMVDRFIPRSYESGQLIAVCGESFKLSVRKEKRKTFSAEINTDTIKIKAPHDLDQHDLNQNLGTLLSRVLSKHFTPKVTKRVLELNKLHFNETINKVSLKNNQSNWGSCSSNRNINLSSRLLFAPPDVMDYVIIHELAHLKEMNHSSKFWSIVENAMSDYKEKDTWLTNNGHSLKF